jgi:Mor family transcriptional regulator
MPKNSDNREALNTLFRRLYVDFGTTSGGAIVRAIVEELGGLRVSVPDLRDLEREERDRRIRVQCNGTNYYALAGRHGITVRQVRNIIDNERRK